VQDPLEVVELLVLLLELQLPPMGISGEEEFYF